MTKPPLIHFDLDHPDSIIRAENRGAWMEYRRRWRARRDAAQRIAELEPDAAKHRNSATGYKNRQPKPRAEQDDKLCRDAFSLFRRIWARRKEGDHRDDVAKLAVNTVLEEKDYEHEYRKTDKYSGEPIALGRDTCVKVVKRGEQLASPVTR